MLGTDKSGGEVGETFYELMNSTYLLLSNLLPFLELLDHLSSFRDIDSSIILEESISGQSAQNIFRESFLCGNVDMLKHFLDRLVDKDKIVYQSLKILCRDTVNQEE